MALWKPKLNMELENLQGSVVFEAKLDSHGIISFLLGVRHDLEIFIMNLTFLVVNRKHFWLF